MSCISIIKKTPQSHQPISSFASMLLEGSGKKSKGRPTRERKSHVRMIVDLPAAQALPPAPTYVTAVEAARIRRQGLSSFWRMVKEGRVPQPVRVSARRPRWLLADILPLPASGKAGDASHG
jgi:predicted DNA-binding transcriptional regulator AlpA